MSVVKISKVNNLKATVKYIMQDYKTDNHLITSFECDEDNIVEDFRDIHFEYMKRRNTDREMGARMIIQSFDSDDNVSPEQAHQYGVEFASNYLKNEHQFLVVTHRETDNVHNHIVFNETNFKTFKLFDSKRENTLTNLRKENDKISEKYGLHIIEAGRVKRQYLSYNEYAVRSRGNSFKEQLENVIDETINESSTYDDFLNKMNEKGYEHKQGKYLSFKNPKSEKFMRTKTLGFNYLEDSIKYRIDHKEYIPFKPKVIKKKWIDKSEKKFQENKGLRRWATIQNINYLNELNKKIYTDEIRPEEVISLAESVDRLESNIQKEFEEIDATIFDLKKMKSCFKDYKDSHGMMSSFKRLETKKEKMEFKKANYEGFKRFDIAKRNINILKKVYGVTNEKQLYETIDKMKEDRNALYSQLNMNIERKEKEDAARLMKKEKKKNEIER